MIEKFENVTSMTKANVYLDGRVISHVIFVNGEKKTLGIFMPGEYEFPTGDAEIMDMTVGDCEVLLPGSDKWEHINEGEKFEIPANSKYSFRCYKPTQYICSYIKG